MPRLTFRSKNRRFGRLILLAVTALVFFPHSVHAEGTVGVTMTVYDNYGYNNAPPLPDDSGRPIVGITTVAQIAQDFDSQPVFNMYEDFIVKYEGYITSPVTGPVVFLPSADDGTQLFIDGVRQDDNWYDKGCCGTPTQPIAFEGGVSQPFTLWFYENGGGAWVELYWDIGNGWELVPASAFTTEPVSPPTTTTTTTTTVTPTTTTSLFFQTTTTTTTVPETTTTTVAPTTVVPTTQQTTTTVAPTTTTTTILSPSTTTIPPVPTTAQPDLLTTPVAALAVEEIKQLLEPGNLEDLSSNELEQVFETLDNADLSQEQADAVAEALSDAPDDVKKTFENTVNVFSGKFDKYVPVGSAINVGQRKVIIAATGVIFAAPTVTASSSASGSSNSRRK